VNVCICYVELCSTSRGHCNVVLHKIRPGPTQQNPVQMPKIPPGHTCAFALFTPSAVSTSSVCLKIEIHKIYEIYMPKYQNPLTKYEIHCLKIEIHKGHEIHSKATLAKYRNPQTTKSILARQSTNQQAIVIVLT